LRTTFDLIEKGGKFSSKSLEDALHEIRKLTPSLGKEHGRVVLKAAKPRLEERLANFREDLKVHQEKVERELQLQLNESRKRIVGYFVPRVMERPPDDMRGRYLKFGEAEARRWLDGEPDRVFSRSWRINPEDAARYSVQGCDVRDVEPGRFSRGRQSSISGN
jgi:hypothetical protein